MRGSWTGGITRRPARRSRSPQALWSRSCSITSRVRGAVLVGYGEWSMDVEWLLEEAARTAARRDWRRMGFPGEDVAYGLIVVTYRRRMGVIAVREMARHRYRQSQYAGLTRLQLDEVGRERQVQRQGARRADALAEGSVELAQAMVPQALALARGGG